MKKRIIAITAAVAAILPVASAFGSSAVYEAEPGRAEYEKYLEDNGYTLYPDQSIFDMSRLKGKNRVYYYKDSDNLYERIRYADLKDPAYYIGFKGEPVPADADLPEDDPTAAQLCEIFGQGYEVEAYRELIGKDSCIFSYKVTAADGIDDRDDFVREMFAKAAEIGELNSFTYQGAGASIAMDTLNNTAVVDPDSMGMTVDELIASLDSFLADMNISFKQDVRMGGTTAVTMKMPADMQISEILAAVQKVHDEYGMTFPMQHLAGATEVFSTVIDVLNSVDGDANCDNELSIADATAIMQAIGNPDEYALSAQGIFNADIYGTGDGITGMDALEVMKGCLIKN